MSLLNLKYRDLLKSPVLDELEAITAETSAWATQEHDTQGHHTDITATSVTSTDGLFEKSRSVAAGYFQDVQPVFDANQFTCEAGMTWTVAIGDVICYRYTRIGNLVTFIIHIGTGSTLGGAMKKAVYLPFPFGMKNRIIDPTVDLFTEAWCKLSDGGVIAEGRMVIESGFDRIQVSRFDAAAFTGPGLGIRGQISFEAQPD